MTEDSRARRRPTGHRGRHIQRTDDATALSQPGAAAVDADAADGSIRSGATPMRFPGAAGSTRSGDAQRLGAPSPGPARADAVPGATAGASATARGRRRAQTEPGSLARAVGWTALTSALPGAGLIPTRLRRTGAALLGILVLLVVGAAVWYLVSSDPLRQLLSLATSRPLLIGLFVAAIVGGLIWIAQILVANLVHNARERLRGGKKATSVVLAVVLMVVAGAPFALAANNLWSAQGLLGNASVFGGEGKGRLKDGADPWKGVGRINVMMLGQDAGADRTGTRPDTIMVASIDTETGRTALFSIPRNIQYVRFPSGTVEAKKFPQGFTAYGRDQNLINAVWSWADDNKALFPGDPNPGLTATRHAVEQTLDLPIDYYAMVDLQGFSDVVNAIGGVDIDVERRIPIGGGHNQATGGTYPVTGVIEKGQQHLDGDRALWYARSRWQSSDWDRMCRQQRMIRIVTEEADPATLALKFPNLVTAAEQNIQTDIPASRLDAFVMLAQRIKKGGYQSYPITESVDKPGAKNWRRYGHPDWDYLHRWVKSSIEDSMTSAAPVSVKGTPVKPTATATSAKPKATTTSASPTTASPTSTPSDSTSAGSSASASAAATPDHPQNPLAGCMPGTATTEDYKGPVSKG